MSRPRKRREPQGGGSSAQRNSRESAKNIADPASPQEAPEYCRSWHSFVTWATGQQFAPTKHMVRIILAELEEAAP